jgi:hypothetical protein
MTLYEQIREKLRKCKPGERFSYGYCVFIRESDRIRVEATMAKSATVSVEEFEKIREKYESQLNSDLGL